MQMYSENKIKNSLRKTCYKVYSDVSDQKEEVYTDIYIYIYLSCLIISLCCDVSPLDGAENNKSAL